jgi:hypothetical protein
MSDREFICPGCQTKRFGWGPIWCKDCRESGQEANPATIVAVARELLGQLVEWQADHEHEWGLDVVLGEEGFRKLWTDKYRWLDPPSQQQLADATDAERGKGHQDGDRLHHNFGREDQSHPR